MGRKRVVGSKLKHDGTLGYISRGRLAAAGSIPPAGIATCRSWPPLQ
ncbi:MAG: hypothetical protein ACLTYW_10600 [Collinsella sp.]